ncbi:DsbA family protein [Salmonella enterica subsp. enterica]|nr:DsbA family protein [Salmonella enterica subsp. enterica serovar Enteritidis]
MQKTIWALFGVGVAAVALAGGYYAARPTVVGAPALVAAAAPEAAGPALDKKAVEEVVRDYLLRDPEILIEVQAALEDKQKEEQRVASVGVIKSAQAEIFNSSTDAVLGNPKGKTTVVEFYDYNCGFCKRAFSDMNELVQSDPELRFVLKELPILGPDSQRAHIVSQAFHRLMPDKYTEFHNKLLGGEERATEDSAIALAVSLGADEAKLREAMQDPSIAETFQRSIELANRLSVTGTPSYVIGDEIVFGAMGADALRQRIADARAACETNAC